MIIIRMQGGLGNQLYQYTLYEKLLILGKDVKLDATYYHKSSLEKDKRELDLVFFQIEQNMFCTKNEANQYIDDNSSITNRIRRKLFGNRTQIIDGDSLTLKQIEELQEGYLQGYFNGEEMLSSMVPILQKKLIFPDIKKSVNFNKNKNTLAQIMSCQSVSVHIRRGDYLKEENVKLFGGIATDEYYKESMKKIQSKYTNPVFFVFTEDIEYAKETFSNKECIIVDNNKDRDSIYDMYLMSMCQSNICANSTFSIWAARLNSNPDKLMIRPKLDYNNQKIEEINLKIKNGWILIDHNGNQVI